MNSIDPLHEHLKFFKSTDPLFYESHNFRKALPKIFRSPVQQHINRLLWMPKGLQWENPDVDNLTDETFAKYQWELKGEEIVKGVDPSSRYLNCLKSVLKKATQVSIVFKRENGLPWYHRELHEDLSADEYRSNSGPNFYELLRAALGSKVKDEHFEMFRLRYEKGMRPREINQLYKTRTAGCISVNICKVKKAVRILLENPNELRRLREKKDDERN